MALVECIVAKGHRKQAVAQVRMKPGTGKYKVNDRPFEEYFPTEALRGYIKQPLVLTDTHAKLDIAATIVGGGQMGQSGALRHGIARALVKHNPSLRSILKNSGMLTCDSRVKERKKSGQPGARKRFQFSKR